MFIFASAIFDNIAVLDSHVCSVSACGHLRCGKGTGYGSPRRRGKSIEQAIYTWLDKMKSICFCCGG